MLKLRRKGRTLLRCWCGCKLGQPLWAVWGLLRTLRAELASTPLLGIYLKETKAQTQKHACVPMCTAALFIEAKMQQQPECPSTVNKAPHTRHTHTHTHTRVLLSHKQEGNPTICNNRVHLQSITLSEIRPMEKEKYCNITYIWNLKEPSSQKE